MDSPQPPVDFFSDNFSLQMSPYGCTFIFGRRYPAVPSQNGRPPIVDTRFGPEPQPLLVRMTPEHLKALVFICWRSVTNVEAAQNGSFLIGDEILKSHNIDPAHWRAFWGDVDAIAKPPVAVGQ